MKTFLFLLRSYPDIDHIAPFIWTCLEKGDVCLIIFDQPYDYQHDYRIQYLLCYPRLQVLPLAGVAAKRRSVRIASRVVWNHFSLTHFLHRHHVDACFLEWGGGTAKSNGLFRVLSDLARDFRAQLFMAARACDLPVIALPHGLNTKLNIDTNSYVMEMLKANDGELPFEDRNEFTVYVFNTEYHRQSYIRYARLDPNKCATWGSIRFCPQWMQIVREICPKALFPEKKNGQMRLLFFLPKWHNRVNKSLTVELLESLSKRKDFQIILKTHPRKGDAEVDDEKFERVLSSENVCVSGPSSSPALIEGADVVIDVGSSIAVEALLQSRPLIYPFYLHENRLIFDEYGGCLRAGNQQEVHKLLDSIIECGESVPTDDDIAIVAKHAVYGGRDPYDVPEYYYEQVERRLSTTIRN